MKWGIKEKLIGLSLCGIFLAIGIGFSGFSGLTHVDTQMDGIVLSGSVMRSQLEADMMHDAIFGNVLSAIIAGEAEDTAQEESVLEALSENTAGFRDRLQGIQENTPSEALKEAIVASLPALEAYLKSADQISRLAFEDHAAALARLPEFNGAYEHLATSMGDLSDLIEKGVLSAQEVGDAAVSSSRPMRVSSLKQPPSFFWHSSCSVRGSHKSQGIKKCFEKKRRKKIFSRYSSRK